MDKPSQVVFVINSLRLGGAERNCVELANAFTQRGIKVTIVVLELKNAVLSQKLLPEVELVNLEIAHARNAFFKLHQIIVKQNTKDYLVFTFQLAVLMVLIRKIYGLKINITARSINSLTQKLENEKSIWHKYVSGFLIKKLFFKVDQIIAQSSGMELELNKIKGEEQVPVTRIFNFLTHSRRIERISEPKTPKKGKQILFVGKLMPQKNLQFLLEAFYFVSLKEPAAKFVIVGDGKDRIVCESWIEQHSIQDKVNLPGWKSDLTPYYENADVFVLGSLYEGFPNVLLEAMDFGVPVVSIDCPSGPEDIIVEGQNGFLVSEYDAALFGTKILEALDKNWDQEEIRRTVDRFDREVAVDQYLEVLSLGG